MRRGAKTNRSGKPLEHALEQLRQQGFAEYVGAAFAKVQCLPSRYVCKHASYITIYGSKGFHEGFIVSDKQNGKEFLANSDGSIHVIIECKFQAGSGSVDEKLPYIELNFLNSNVMNWILILDGAWWTKPGRGALAVKYMKLRAKEISDDNRQLLVLNRKEFSELVFRAWGPNNG